MEERLSALIEELCEQHFKLDSGKTWEEASEAEKACVRYDVTVIYIRVATFLHEEMERNEQ